MKHYSRCGGQRAVECGDDPPGGLSTLSAHQIAHGGVVPHSSSSELSAHQMRARDDLWKGKPAMMATMIPRQKLRLLFGAKTGKGRVRRHMMWLPHHSRIFTVFSTRLSWGLGLLGHTRKPLGRIRLSISRVLVELSVMHAPTPVMRVKRKAHTTSRTSRQFVRPMNHRGGRCGVHG